MGTSYHKLFLFFSLFSLFAALLARGLPNDPTEGFVELPFNTSFYHIQKPYDIPVDQRYSFINGVHKLWVYSTDQPLSRNSPTMPRTEIIISGYTYSSGTWQFEGYGFVPNGTSGVCIMQVFGASPHATTAMLMVYNGSLTYYRATALVPNIHDRWFRVNVIHDVDASKVRIYIDGVFIFEAAGRGGTSHYFKCGVYSQPDDSHYMESRWKGIKVLKKNVTHLLWDLSVFLEDDHLVYVWHVKSNMFLLSLFLALRLKGDLNVFGV